MHKAENEGSCSIFRVHCNGINVVGQIYCSQKIMVQYYWKIYNHLYDFNVKTKLKCNLESKFYRVI